MLAPSTRLQDRYLIERQLGKGGMGEVYLAYEESLRRYVAIKRLLSTGDPDEAQAFLREAQLLANLRHPVLPLVYHTFVTPEGNFLVMEYIDGDDLDALLQQGGPLPVDEVRAWADDLCDALIYLHSKGIIHRDIKPQNVKLSSEGKVKLLDFGIAKNEGQLLAVTCQSVRAYSIQYSPPEQFEMASNS